MLDAASRPYEAGEPCTGLVKAVVPYPVEIDLAGL